MLTTTAAPRDPIFPIAPPAPAGSGGHEPPAALSRCYLRAFPGPPSSGGVPTLLSSAGRPSAQPQTDVVALVEEFITDGQQRSYIDFGLHVILTPRDDFAEVLPELFDLGGTSSKNFLAFPPQQRVRAIGRDTV
mgnify:CR=1 FL=1